MPQFLVSAEDVHRDRNQAVIRGDEAHHLLKVFRARLGDLVILFDGAGSRWSGRLAECRPNRPEARMVGLETLPGNEGKVQITLIQGIPKGDRWEWILEKGTELGVHRFVPVASRFTAASIGQERVRAKIARWRLLVTSAAKQCERGRIPEVEAPGELLELLARLQRPGKGEMRWVLSERWCGSAVVPCGEVHRILLAVGPEGGWAPEELAAFHGAAFEPLSLGPRILRSETAAVAAIVAAQLRWGDLVPGTAP